MLLRQWPMQRSQPGRCQSPSSSVVKNGSKIQPGILRGDAATSVAGGSADELAGGGLGCSRAWASSSSGRRGAAGAELTPFGRGAAQLTALLLERLLRVHARSAFDRKGAGRGYALKAMSGPMRRGVCRRHCSAPRSISHLRWSPCFAAEGHQWRVGPLTARWLLREFPGGIGRLALRASAVGHARSRRWWAVAG